MALERLTHEAATIQVTYRSDKAEGPTAGSETVDVLEFLARLVTHIPDPHQVLTRYYGWYANRTRGIRHRAGGAHAPPRQPAGGGRPHTRLVHPPARGWLTAALPSILPTR